MDVVVGLVVVLIIMVGAALYKLQPPPAPQCAIDTMHKRNLPLVVSSVLYTSMPYDGEMLIWFEFAGVKPIVDSFNPYTTHNVVSYKFKMKNQSKVYGYPYTFELVEKDNTVLAIPIEPRNAMYSKDASVAELSNNIAQHGIITLTRLQGASVFELSMVGIDNIVKKNYVPASMLLSYHPIVAEERPEFKNIIDAHNSMQLAS